MALSSSSTDYAQTPPTDAIQLGWQQFSDTKTWASNVNGGDSTYIFDSGFDYRDIYIRVQVSAAQCTLLRICAGTDSNQFLPVFIAGSHTETVGTKEFIENRNQVIGSIAGTMNLKVGATSLGGTVTASMWLYGVKRRKHDGQSFNNNGSIWLKSGDLIEIGETHFSNSQAMCHIELYNVQS